MFTRVQFFCYLPKTYTLSLLTVQLLFLAMVPEAKTDPGQAYQFEGIDADNRTLSSSVNAAGYSTLPDSFPLFDDHEVLKITLEFNERTVLRDRGEETDYHPLKISWTDRDSTLTTVDARIKVRGNFRRKRINCRFPPLRIRFDPETVAGTVFEGQKKLKLVTHCQTKRSQYEQYLLHEYLIYRSYNIVSPKSFRVRLLEITYKDSRGKGDSFTRYGFVLEDEDKMARRLGGRIVEVQNVHPDQTEYELSNTLAIFQYMMGNTDWSISALHNIKLVMLDSGDPPVAVPYDFDWSGIINTGYAEPSRILDIKTVRERVFRGFCRSEAEFTEAFQEFKNNKEAIYALYREHSPPLEQSELSQALEYLDEFYEIINSMSKSKREIIDRCRTDK